LTRLREKAAINAPIPAPPAAAVDALWGSVLLIPVGPGAGDDFEARVQRAWSYIKAAHFAAEEHGRLREVLGVVIADEVAGRKRTPSTTTP
jgi:hypothetical protein